MAKVDKKAFRRSFWGSLARAVGVLLSVGAGTALRQFIGDNLIVLSVCALLGFFLMWIAEYLSEI